MNGPYSRSVLLPSIPSREPVYRNSHPVARTLRHPPPRVKELAISPQNSALEGPTATLANIDSITQAIPTTAFSRRGRDTGCRAPPTDADSPLSRIRFPPCMVTRRASGPGQLKQYRSVDEIVRVAPLTRHCVRIVSGCSPWTGLAPAGARQPVLALRPRDVMSRSALTAVDLPRSARRIRQCFQRFQLLDLLR